MYKVFINDKPLFLSEKISPPEGDNNAMVIEHGSAISIERAVDILENEKNKNITSVYIKADKDELWELLCKMFEKVEAAGGIVKNTKGELLFIFRFGKWDLPKGKLDKHEKAERGAMREVEEECGIGDLRIISELPPTYHAYILNGRRKLKHTRWYVMETDSTAQPIAQQEEDILDARWIKPEEVSHLMKNTYNSIREVIDHYFGRVSS